MDKFKVGDKVKLVRINSEGPWYKKYLGNVYTIKNFETDNYGRFARFKETSDVMPYVKNLELVKEEYTYEDLKESPIGTKVTFESGIILIKVDKENYKEIKEYGTTRYIELLEGLKDNWQYMNQGKIIKIEEPTYKTVYEHKEEILDETEKRYLRSVIKPFRDRVTFISKLHTREDKEFISINLKNGDYIDLPLFKENTMYKKMIINKDYTLKELGL